MQWCLIDQKHIYSCKWNICVKINPHKMNRVIRDGRCRSVKTAPESYRLSCLSLTPRSGCGPPLLSPAASRRHSRSTSALSTADPHSQSGDLHAQTSRSLSVHPAALSRQTPTLLEAELTQHVSVVVFSDVRIHLSMTSEYSWAFCSVF